MSLNKRNRWEQFEFEEVVSVVEERFVRAYDAESLGVAKYANEVKYKMISSGWWLRIKSLGVALRVGDEKPEIKPGDTLAISIRKIDDGSGRSYVDCGSGKPPAR
jgi:hypothetical protein